MQKTVRQLIIHRGKKLAVQVRDLLLRFLCQFSFPRSCFSSGAADTALAEPSGSGGGASAHSPQSANYIGNVSVRRSASSAVRELGERVDEGSPTFCRAARAIRPAAAGILPIAAGSGFPVPSDGPT